MLGIIAINQPGYVAMFGNFGRTFKGRRTGTHFLSVYLFLCGQIIAYSIISRVHLVTFWCPYGMVPYQELNTALGNWLVGYSVIVARSGLQMGSPFFQIHSY